MYHQYQNSIGERLRYKGGKDNPQFQEGYNSNGEKNPYAKGSISWDYFQLGVAHKEIEALGPIEM
jgi:hypothetical protein